MQMPELDAFVAHAPEFADYRIRLSIPGIRPQ
jgi:hypothetical protein